MLTVGTETICMMAQNCCIFITSQSCIWCKFCIRSLTAKAFPFSLTDSNTIPDEDDDGDVDEGSLLECFDGWGLMWLALNCVRLHVFLCTRKDRQYLGLNRRCVTGDAHVKTHCTDWWWWWWYATLFLISSAAWGSSGVSHPHVPESSSPMLACYTSATPLFLFSRCLSFSLSLINVKSFNNKASILSLPAFSALHVCHCALTLPLPWPKQPPSSFHMAVELKPRAHTADMKGSQAAWGGGGQKNKEEAFLSLPSLLPQEKKKFFIFTKLMEYTGKNRPLSGKEKSLDGVIVAGRVQRYVCHPLCPWTYLSYFSSFISASHTHSLCPMFAVNLWCKSIASLAIKTVLCGGEGGIILTCPRTPGK